MKIRKGQHLVAQVIPNMHNGIDANIVAHLVAYALIQMLHVEFQNSLQLNNTDYILTLQRN